ncbi:hypothetical protein E5288_WYG021667 [Bos mutus]|uniref:Uncharacterized protein n=1 Tax=Bos mutus TaxID=72004 RepID=A0A6B0S005_9CETA|nr:hypothetical protein [Bos mutus]
MKEPSVEGGATSRALGLGSGSPNGRSGNNASVRKRRRPCRAVAAGCRGPACPSPLPSPSAPPPRPLRSLA